MPCSIPGFGTFNPADDCYWQLADPQPPAGDPLWQGHGPGDGAVYTVSCGWPGLVVGTPTWSATPPPGVGGGPTPEQLALQALNKLPLHGPDIGISANMSANGAGLVGLPVWMWTTVRADTWGPVSATAAVPGLSVTATARGTKIVWTMGDGSTVTCNNPGTPYQPSYGAQSSPTCGHTYTKASRQQPNGKYAITATTTWEVTWAGGGQNGVIVVTRSSNAAVTIQELQLVTT